MKRIHKVAQAALLALSFLASSTAHAANDWVNFATISMTDPATPKLTNGYGCRTDGKDILCDSAASAVNFGTGGLIDYGGLTVVGSISASAVSTTYVSATVLQINPSNMSCSAGLNGTIRYSNSSNSLEVCIGTSWSALSSNTTPGNISGGGSATAVAFWNGPNSLTYESATTSGLYWDHPNSRLGIGTTTPTEALSIVSTTGGPASFSLNRPDGYGYVLENYANGRRLDIGYKTTNRAEGAWYPGNPAISIPFAGNVGVNTGSPTATLQVSGTFTVSNSGQSTNPSLFADTSGNVIIGSTTTPWGKLHVGGSVSLRDYGGGDARLFSYSGDGSIVTELFAFNGLGGYAGTYTNNPFFIRTGDINRMAFTSSGSIGIGTANPGSSLTIVGEVQPGSSGAACVTATNGGAIRYSAGTLYYCNGSNAWTAISGGGAGFTGGGSATAIAFWNGTNSLTYESATTSGLYWDHTNGYLGIGRNYPQFALDVTGVGGASGLIAARTSGTTGSDFAGLRLLSPNSTVAGGQLYIPGIVSPVMVLANTEPGGDLSFQTDGATERIRVKSGSGNVGIGMIAPNATLQVSGTFIVSQSGQNSLSSASLAVDSRGVSVSSIVHINGSAFSPIGAGGNAILSGTTAVSTSSAGSITFYGGGAQRMTIDGATGNVGIGTSSPSSPLFVAGTSAPAAFYNSGGGVWQVRLSNTTTTNGVLLGSVGDALLFGTNGSNERMRIDSGGHVMINTTAPNAWLTINNTTSYSGLSISGYGNGIGYGIYLRPANDSGPTPIVFLNAGGSVVGSVGTNSTNTAYNTSSDRRVKENITDSREGLQKLMRIGVKEFSFRADPSHTIVNGFIAQDLEHVYPEAVTTNGDNGEVPLKDTKHIWQVDYGRVTPLIVKAVQDLNEKLEADNDALEAQVKALKAANDNLVVRVNLLEKKTTSK